MAGKVPGTTVFHDPVNNITVITDTASGRVVTVDFGQMRASRNASAASLTSPRMHWRHTAAEYLAWTVDC
jgi:hypothetical protein